jgi:hypothetical protein
MLKSLLRITTLFLPSLVRKVSLTSVPCKEKGTGAGSVSDSMESFRSQRDRQKGSEEGVRERERRMRQVVAM